MHMYFPSPAVSLHMLNDRINVLAKAYLGVYEGTRTDYYHTGFVELLFSFSPPPSFSLHLNR